MSHEAFTKLVGLRADYTIRIGWDVEDFLMWEAELAEEDGSHDS